MLHYAPNLRVLWVGAFFRNNPTAVVISVNIDLQYISLSQRSGIFSEKKRYVRREKMPYQS
jgi:hypothetical protein